jgi:predicted Zn-ribbon and HTH transcriptional regulator
MEKCPKCHFRSMGDYTVRDDEKVVEASSKCKKCGHVERIKDYQKPRWFRRRR